MPEKPHLRVLAPSRDATEAGERLSIVVAVLTFRRPDLLADTGEVTETLDEPDPSPGAAGDGADGGGEVMPGPVDELAVGLLAAVVASVFDGLVVLDDLGSLASSTPRPPPAASPAAAAAPRDPLPA